MTRRAKKNFMLGLLILGSLDVIMLLGRAGPGHPPDWFDVAYGSGVILFGGLGWWFERRKDTAPTPRD